MESSQIRPYYAQLMGLLVQLPEKEDVLVHEATVNFYHNIIVSLSKLTGEEFVIFEVDVLRGSGVRPYARMVDIRTKLGALISMLHAQYFSDEPHPFSRGPHTVITQSQQQSQSVLVQTFIDDINRKLDEHAEGSKEKTFLTKLKDKLGNVSNILDLVKIVVMTAKEYGLNVDELKSIFL